MTDDLAATDALLQNAWSDFCDQLKEAGQLVFSHDGPANAQNRAAGFEYLARYIPQALDQRFNCYDTDHPQLFWAQTPTSKSFGDNPDCTYLVGFVDGSRTYRLVGSRGTAKWVSLTVGPRDPSLYSVISNDDLITNWDGSFEVTLSAKKSTGNWMALQPGLNRIFIRQYFGSWHTEEPMHIRVECLDVEDPPPPPTPEGVAHRLGDTIRWLREDSQMWSRWVSYYRQWPNQFIQGMPDFIGIDDQSRIARQLSFCHWQVEPDQALLITVEPPECCYWNFEMNNEWMNSVDYRYRLSSINGEQASLNPDGTVVIVLSHRDPGARNWLDAAGYTSGSIQQRWVESSDCPCPQARLVRLDEMEAALPAGTPRISAAERREQLRLRKVGVDRRFRT